MIIDVAQRDYVSLTSNFSVLGGSDSIFKAEGLRLLVSGLAVVGGISEWEG